MRERLTKLIGKQRTSSVKMGTFHALCAMFLRKYGRLVGLDQNFTICDADESKKIVSTLLKAFKEFLEEKNISLKEATVLSMISKAKAKGHTSDELFSKLSEASRDAKKLQAASLWTNDVEYLVAEIYQQYEKILRSNNSLDFDDLLLLGVKLFTEHKKTVSWCKHVLVDEFQDTNVMQYELMKALAVDRCVSVVGDPDQSIYGWRSAEVENLAKMRRDFLGTEEIFLEQNYRSTAAVLKASLAIVAQDKSRIRKSLYTNHPSGATPVLRAFPTEHAEATFIAVECRRLVAEMGGILRWGDFVVLLRFNALSRAIESALQKEGIPSRVLGGHKFFERLEIKNLLGYLQLVDNPNFNPALTRAVNTPSRGIGEKTLLEVSTRAEKAKLSQLHVIERICDGTLADINPTAKRKFLPFVEVIRALRDLAEKGTSPPDLIRRLVELLEYEDYLRRTQPDWESRWENVQELITFASEVEVGSVDEQDFEEISTGHSPKDTPLRLFLQASMLSSEGDNQNEDNNTEKVTITTCHAAKGLEWPVVMVPAVEEGTFPFYRTEDIEEERRLLYVACTRAQGLLYLSHAAVRKVAGETKTKKLSEFVSVVTNQNPTLFTGSSLDFRRDDRMVICKVLDRPLPDEEEVYRRVTEFIWTSRHHVTGSDELARVSLGDAAKPLVNAQQISTSFTTVLNLEKSSIPFGVHASELDSQVTSFNTSQLARLCTKVATPHSSILPATRFSHLSRSSNNENVLPTKPSAPVSTQAGSQGSQMNIGLTSAQGVKRRLGMGRGGVGYSNKKFKPPT